MEASFFHKTEGMSVRCELCPNFCRIPDGGYGSCRIRANRGGTLYAEGYGKAVSFAVDPVEKKPLYHFHPSRRILSTGPNGCNFHCGFCQNSSISQTRSSVADISPSQLAALAEEEGSIGVAYTYTEPFVWYEFVRDAGELVHQRGLANVLVTNGYVNEQPLREILPLVDAMNIDLKSMRPDFYRQVCGGSLKDVQRTIVIAAQSCHIELTNLIIPGYNDTEEDFRKLIDWVYSVNPAIPLHFSRYFPRYRFTAPETSEETLFLAYDMARSRLKYVYMGNVPYSGVSDTRCPSCGNVLVTRSLYAVRVIGIREGVCSACGSTVDFVGLKS
jgi:pyruvate formate lyase activating enzyme